MGEEDYQPDPKSLIVAIASRIVAIASLLAGPLLVGLAPVMFIFGPDGMAMLLWNADRPERFAVGGSGPKALLTLMMLVAGTWVGAVVWGKYPELRKFMFPLYWLFGGLAVGTLVILNFIYGHLSFW